MVLDVAGTTMGIDVDLRELEQGLEIDSMIDWPEIPREEEIVQLGVGQETKPQGGDVDELRMGTNESHTVGEREIVSSTNGGIAEEFREVDIEQSADTEDNVVGPSFDDMPDSFPDIPHLDSSGMGSNQHDLDFDLDMSAIENELGFSSELDSAVDEGVGGFLEGIATEVKNQSERSPSGVLDEGQSAEEVEAVQTSLGEGHGDAVESVSAKEVEQSTKVERTLTGESHSSHSTTNLDLDFSASSDNVTRDTDADTGDRKATSPLSELLSPSVQSLLLEGENAQGELEPTGERSVDNVSKNEAVEGGNEARVSSIHVHIGAGAADATSEETDVALSSGIGNADREPVSEASSGPSDLSQQNDDLHPAVDQLSTGPDGDGTSVVEVAVSTLGHPGHSLDEPTLAEEDDPSTTRKDTSGSDNSGTGTMFSAPTIPTTSYIDAVQASPSTLITNSNLTSNTNTSSNLPSNTTFNSNTNINPNPSSNPDLRTSSSSPSGPQHSFSPQFHPTSSIVAPSSSTSSPSNQPTTVVHADSSSTAAVTPAESMPVTTTPAASSQNSPSSSTKPPRPSGVSTHPVSAYTPAPSSDQLRFQPQPQPQQQQAGPSSSANVAVNGGAPPTSVSSNAIASGSGSEHLPSSSRKGPVNQKIVTMLELNAELFKCVFYQLAAFIYTTPPLFLPLFHIYAYLFSSHIRFVIKRVFAKFRFIN